MLIEFSVKNYRSFKDQQTLSLVKAKGGELADTNAFKSEALPGHGLLKAAAVYGPNASGKSNLLRAVGVVRDMVLESASKGQRGGSLPVTPFRLDAETADSPSEFEIIFAVGGIRYQYGFAATRERVTEEWLMAALGDDEPQCWFERSWDEAEKAYEWDMDSSFQGQKQQKRVWRESTRSNALFLSTAVQLNNSQLQPIYDWFMDKLLVIDAADVNSIVVSSDREQVYGFHSEGVINIMKAADLDIDDINVENRRRIFITRNTAQGGKVKFDLNGESSGTQKLFFLSVLMTDRLSNGGLLLVDKLDKSFHPMMTGFILSLFRSKNTNSGNAQLVFTAHGTSAMDERILQRDQIWFCEKNRDQASILYSLSDFISGDGYENIEANYLSGKYGAIPLIKADDLLDEILV